MLEKDIQSFGRNSAKKLMRGPILPTELESVTGRLQSSPEYWVNPRFTCHKPPEMGLRWALAKVVLANLLSNPFFPSCAIFPMGLVFLKGQIFSWHNSAPSHRSQWSIHMVTFVSTKQSKERVMEEQQTGYWHKDAPFASAVPFAIKRSLSRKVRHFSWHGEERSLTQAESEWKNFYQGSAKYKSLTETPQSRRFGNRTVAS